MQIPLNDPERLFSRDHDERKTTYHELVKQWHPDVPGGSAKVFDHITKLYRAAEEGRWDSAQILTIIAKRAKNEYQFKYKIRHPFELGDVYINKKTVVWFIKKEHEDLVLNGIKTIGNVKFPDVKMKEQHAKFIPIITTTIESNEGYYVVMKKTEDVILTDDLITHLGRIPPKHMAWMVSSLLNILCFYQITGITHNGLTTGSVFVSPKNHAVFPIGGWWYSKRAGTTLKYLPPIVHKAAPSSVLSRKCADLRVDLASVKAIARAAVGNLTSDIPKPLANWLRLPPAKDAITEYQLWERVLKDSWGQRRFLKLDIDLSAIYK